MEPTDLTKAIFLRKELLILPVIMAVFQSGLAPDASGYSISVQPIQVCSSGICADLEQELFQAETQKIWNQADIGVNFLPWNIFDAIDNPYYDLDINTEFDDMILGAGYGKNTSDLVIDMWFVNSLNNSPYVYGVSTLDWGYIAISDSIFDWNAGLGRIDTIAHEIGHALGLDHYAGINTSLNLMASGGVRLVPTTISDIYPDGKDYSQLTMEQIELVLESDYVFDTPIPEPATLLILGSGMGLISLIRRRSRVQ